MIMRNNIKEYLKRVYDFERLTGRIACGSANGKDLIALRNSCAALPDSITLTFHRPLARSFWLKPTADTDTLSASILADRQQHRGGSAFYDKRGQSDKRKGIPRA